MARWEHQLLVVQNRTTNMMCMDAWTFIPLMIIMLLAGLRFAKRSVEAAKVDGANKWTMFKNIIFPIMLPVSLTTLVIRIIFKLKLADIIIIVTAGGPELQTV